MRSHFKCDNCPREWHVIGRFGGHECDGPYVAAISLAISARMNTCSAHLAVDSKLFFSPPRSKAPNTMITCGTLDQHVPGRVPGICRFEGKLHQIYFDGLLTVGRIGHVEVIFILAFLFDFIKDTTSSYIVYLRILRWRQQMRIKT